jgi:hypothetical protein
MTPIWRILSRLFALAALAVGVVALLLLAVAAALDPETGR